MTDQQTLTRDQERAEVLHKAGKAKEVTPAVARLTTPHKDEILLAAADDLIALRGKILAANEADLQAGRDRGMSESLLDRLALNAEGIEGIAGGLREVAGLSDPVGEVLQGRRMGNGIEMKQV